MEKREFERAQILFFHFSEAVFPSLIFFL